VRVDEHQLASVTVRRNHARDARQPRIFARVDHGANHTFTYGHAVTVSLTPGPHVLNVRYGLYRRGIKFTVAPGEHARFMLIGLPRIPGLGALARRRLAPSKVEIERSA
jgi:hypothetical protein